MEDYTYLGVSVSSYAAKFDRIAAFSVGSHGSLIANIGLYDRRVNVSCGPGQSPCVCTTQLKLKVVCVLKPSPPFLSPTLSSAPSNGCCAPISSRSRYDSRGIQMPRGLVGIKIQRRIQFVFQ